MSDSLWPQGLQPTRLLRPWHFPGKSTGVGWHFLLQGIFRTRGSNLGLLHCDPMDYTAHGILQARILEWAAFAFSRGSSQPRDQTQVSHIAGRGFTSWATRVFVTFKSDVHVFHKIRRTGTLQGLGLCPGWPNSVKNQGVSGEETIDTPPEHSDLASYQGCGHSSRVV